MLLHTLLFLSLMLSIPVYGQSGSIGYDGSDPIWGQDGSIGITTGESGYNSNDPGGYSGMPQAGYGTPLAPADQSSPDSLAQYQEFYSFDQRTQTQAGPVQFDIYRSEPTYLIINGQSQPYNQNYVPYNSLWIQGTTRWTQYIQCPINARFKLLAYTQGGLVTVVEVYPNGYQHVNNYQFHPGYTQLYFWADVVGRHTLTFNTYGQKSNSIVVDVVPYNGPYVPRYTPPAGYPITSTGQILVDSADQGFNPNAPPEGYNEPSTQPGRILVDSTANGFDPTAPPQGEAI